MQSHNSLPKRVRRGKKRKLFKMRANILAKKSTWHTRKPTHLTVQDGFLPADSCYDVKQVLCHDDLNDISGKNKRFILKDCEKASSPNQYFVIERCDDYPSESIRFSKFNSVLQVLIASLYDTDECKFRAVSVAMCATKQINNRYETIFEFTKEEFKMEYRYWKENYGCTIPAVENGLLLVDSPEHSVAIVKRKLQGDCLLERLHSFLQKNITKIVPTEKELTTIASHFCSVKNFRLHFDCLYLLTNAELSALAYEGNPIKQYATSAFDLLYDVWVCCYLEHMQKYRLLHLSSETWDNFRLGKPLQLTEYSNDIRNFMEKEALSAYAVRAAKHYDFFGNHYIIPESSVCYQRFVKKCINA